jgi:ethanolaminephosphotransferase
MGYITKDGAEGLRQYQYRGRDLSLVYKYVLTPMNNVLINWIPLWMAPNVVTMIGVIASLSSYFMLQYYCPTLEGPAPWWVFVYDAVATFTYQVCFHLQLLFNFSAPYPPPRNTCCCHYAHNHLV